MSSVFVNIAEVIKGNGKHIPRVVKLWVESYEKDPKPAMVELLTMLFEVTYSHSSLMRLNEGVCFLRSERVNFPNKHLVDITLTCIVYQLYRHAEQSTAFKENS